MKPSSEVQKIERKRGVDLTLLSAFFCLGFYASPGFAQPDSKLFIAQQNAPPQAPYQQYQQQYQSTPPLQWQGQPPQTGLPPGAAGASGAPGQRSGQAAVNGQWAPPQGQGMGPAGSAPNQYPLYQGTMPPQQWQGSPLQAIQQQPPQGMYGQQPNYSGGAPPANYGPLPTSAPLQYGAAPQYQQQQGQNWNYQNQQPNLQGQATQSYAPPPVENQVPTPPPNEGYPSMDELNETFQQNPAKNVQAPSTAEKVGTGLLNIVKNSMMAPGGMGMGGYGMPYGGGYGMPYGGGYGMPYGAAPMGYPMMGSPGLLGAPMGTMGGGSMMNNILNQGMRMFRF
ncbi:MAG: hypothetical protein IT342_05840 [Candidatus Melainabacteria bacterium]|nr:hypothetical protein [Candidatus Melainabacteria bacterium]